MAEITVLVGSTSPGVWALLKNVYTAIMHVWMKTLSYPPNKGLMVLFSPFKGTLERSEGKSKGELRKTEMLPDGLGLSSFVGPPGGEEYRFKISVSFIGLSINTSLIMGKTLKGPSNMDRPLMW